jgi:Pyridine nucleotide-disulphide oxidoreductase
VLERGRVGQTWRDRWDSFCLVTPNWTVQLPGYAYDGADPDGFMPRDEIVAYVERYAAEAPVREGVDVRSIDSADSGFALHTSAGAVTASRVVIATGAHQRSHRPQAAATRDRLPRPPGRIASDAGRPARREHPLDGPGRGHDLHLRTLREAGVTLTGHFLGATGGEARFAPDLGESVAWGDERYDQFASLVRNHARERGLDEPALDEPAPFDDRRPERVDLRGFGASSSPRDSARTTHGWPGREPSTGLAFRSTRTVRARRYPGCTSWASTSSASASRHCSSGSVRTPQSSRSASQLASARSVRLLGPSFVAGRTSIRPRKRRLPCARTPRFA